MVGQPTETDHDVLEIVRIADAVKKIGQSHIGNRAKVRVSTSNFIPKAHTPYQWVSQCDPETLRRRHKLLRNGCRDVGVQFTWEDPEKSILEAVLSRGDRRIADVIEYAWEKGAKFDGWSEHHDWNIWNQAFLHFGLDPQFYAHRNRDLWETLPWAHIHGGTEPSYLRGEWLNTLEQEITLDCKSDPCNVCGMQNLQQDCVIKINDLVQMKISGDTTKKERLFQEKERLLVNLNPINN